MTDQADISSGTDAVLAAIDGALAWRGPANPDWVATDPDTRWEADAMSWSGATLDTADQRREAADQAPRLLSWFLPGYDVDRYTHEPEDDEGWPPFTGARLYWVRGDRADESRSGAAEPRREPPTEPQTLRPEDGWVDAGYITEEPVTNVHDVIYQRLRDLLLHGSAYADGHGNRVNPADVVVRERHRGIAAFQVPPVDLSGVRAAATRVGEAFRRGMEQAAPQVRLNMAAIAAQLSRRITPDSPPPAPHHETVAERALQARRDRNTGPTRVPYARRGSTRR